MADAGEEGGGARLEKSPSVSGGHIVLGNGDGTFRPAQRYVSGAGQNSLAAADFNGDGKPDLVMTRSVGGADGLVTVLLGNGDGTFEAPLSFTASRYPFAATNLSVGDFNGDELPDVAVSVTGWHVGRGSESFVRVLLNDGSWPGSPLPAAQQVYVSGSAWSDSFKQHLENRGLGSARHGFAILAGDQLNELPWANLDQVSITFSGPVRVERDDLRVRGSNVPSCAVSGFEYDPATRTATWTLDRSLRDDRVVLELVGDAGGVTDLQGRPLDGEWASGADGYPSGDGTAGGDFAFRLDVVPGDVSRDGGVNSSDVIQVRNRPGTTPTRDNALGQSYGVFHDVNGDGGINSSDVIQTRNRQGSSLAGVPEPVGTTAPAPPPGGITGLLFAEATIL